MAKFNPINYTNYGIAKHAIAGDLFGSDSKPLPSDPMAGSYGDEGGISGMWARIQNGQYQWGNPDDKAATVIKDYMSIFNRLPTSAEINAALPAAQAGQGGAFISQLKQAADNTPEALANKQQKAAQDAYSKNKGQFDSQVGSAFQQSVGRDPTADEAAHFGQLLASGQVDAYGVQQLLGQTTEAQNRQTSQYQNQLSQNLQGTQGDYYKNYILPQIMSQTAAAGRDPNSSGVQQAAVQAGKQQNYELQNYLAQFGAGQYGQSAENQQGMYQAYLGNLYGRQNANISDQLAQRNYAQQTSQGYQNYNMQQQAYNNYLRQFGNRQNGLGGLIGGIAGAGLGAYAGGPQGAAAGYGVGSGIGTSIEGASGGRNAYL